MEQPSAEPDTLERLRGDEATLEREIVAVRAEGASAIEGARREAERISAEMRRAVDAERALLRAEEAARIEGALAEARATLDVEAAALMARAARNRERAIARALAVVLGRVT